MNAGLQEASFSHPHDAQHGNLPRLPLACIHRLSGRTHCNPGRKVLWANSVDMVTRTAALAGRDSIVSFFSRPQYTQMPRLLRMLMKMILPYPLRLEGGHSVLLNDVLSAKWSSDGKLMCPQVAHSTGRHQ